MLNQSYLKNENITIIVSRPTRLNFQSWNVLSKFESQIKTAFVNSTTMYMHLKV